MGIGTLDQESKSSCILCLRHITKGANFDLEWLRSSLNDGPGLRIDIFVQEEDRVVGPAPRAASKGHRLSGRGRFIEHRCICDG